MSAYAKATALGCRIEREQFGMWGWSYGTHARSSNDHYGLQFLTAEGAAEHFLSSREGQNAAKLAARLPVPHRSDAL